MISRLIPIILIWLLIDFYFFQAVKTVTTSSVVYWVYWLYDGLLLALIIHFILSNGHTISSPRGQNWIIGLMLVSLVPKLLVTPLLLLEDLGRLLHYGARAVAHLLGLSGSRDTAIHFAKRRRFISQIVLGLAAVPFLALIEGMVKGKYDYKVHRIRLAFDDLPAAFDGFKIIQLSDIHVGSFGSKPDVERGVELANQQKGDLLLFTGDLVNAKADELDGWKEVFSKLRAPYGQYSILGNHDYGDYVRWETPKAKADNLQRLKDIEKEMGFSLLLDQNVKIEKDGQRITLIGVQNWSKRGFHSYGNLHKATEGINDADFKVLMSHDPTHWEAEVLNHPKHIHLTLSGHTHGMQFGVEIKGFKWSPIKYMYHQWAGIYKKGNKYINVNRGFGFIGYPGRVGILPEITVIELAKANGKTKAGSQESFM